MNDEKDAAPKTFWDECDYMILWNKDAPDVEQTMNDKKTADAAGQMRGGLYEVKKNPRRK